MLMADVVIPVKKQGRHDDLKFALRSIAKNYKVDRIYIAGYKPLWVRNVEEVSRDQSRHSYRANAFLNVQKAVNRKDIGEQIVISCDDIFFMKPVSTIPLGHGLQIRDQRWAKEWPYTHQLLKKCGVYGRRSFELHIPMLVEKDKIRYILSLIRREYPADYDKVQWRSVYYNYFGLQGEPLADVKTWGTPEIADTQQFFSTEDHTFKYSRRLLEACFPDRCIYEK